MIPFNIPPYLGIEQEYIAHSIQNRKLCGDGAYTGKCNAWFREHVGGAKALLTTSGTHALEMAALLCDIRPGDEVIMPSYTFVSTANAFVLRGARIVFVDINPCTMNMDETLIEAAITPKTKAIVPVHYAGVSCEMDAINNIAGRYGLFVVEDAAQAIASTYKGRQCGTLGDFGCFSFHETKNLSCGEGGALIVRDSTFAEKAEIIREKGTNRSQFFRGEVDKYTWCDIGSSYLPSELNAAYLLAQLERADEIMDNRMQTWVFYYDSLLDLVKDGRIKTAVIPPSHCQHNGHMFWLKAKDLDERTSLLAFLKENGVHAVFHYIPLHSSEAGRKNGRFHGEDRWTTAESERIVRLPLYYGMTQNDREKVADLVYDFYKKN